MVQILTLLILAMTMSEIEVRFFAYFAGPHDRSIAEEYNQSYGEGLLEVIIDSVSYIEYFKPLEFRYDEQNGIVGLSPIIHEC